MILLFEKAPRFTFMYNARMEHKKSTSWQPVAKWYDTLVSDKGQYYHEHVVIPGVLRLLSLDQSSRLLDAACGQGVLGRAIPGEVSYTGFDIAPSLIESAKKADKSEKHTYLVGDNNPPFAFGQMDLHACRDRSCHRKYRGARGRYRTYSGAFSLKSHTRTCSQPSEFQDSPPK